MQKNWRVIPVDEDKVISLQQQLKIHPAICRLLVQRVITSFESARQFYRPSLDELHSPWLMKDMEKAVGRIMAAISMQEKILVFGDYDVDGTTSVAIMYLFLKK